MEIKNYELAKEKAKELNIVTVGKPKYILIAQVNLKLYEIEQSLKQMNKLTYKDLVLEDIGESVCNGYGTAKTIERIRANYSKLTKQNMIDITECFATINREMDEREDDPTITDDNFSMEDFNVWLQNHLDILLAKL